MGITVKQIKKRDGKRVQRGEVYKKKRGDESMKVATFPERLNLHMQHKFTTR
jgi:hypothetical protein